MKAIILTSKNIKKKDGSPLTISQILLENGDIKTHFTSAPLNVDEVGASALISDYQSVDVQFDQRGNIYSIE